MRKRKVVEVLTVMLVGTALAVTSVFSGAHTEAGTRVQEAKTTVYVAVDGRADATGTIEDPFATIEQARDYLRTQDISEQNRGTVYVRGGDYYVDAKNPTVEITSGDSYVTYAAYQDEHVKLSGTVVLEESGFKRLSEVEGSQFASQVRLPDSVKDSVYVYDLGAEGISVGVINKNGFNWTKQPFQPELLVDGSLQTLAQYPNSGYLTMADILAGKTKNGQGEDETAKAAGANEGERPRNYIFDKTDTPKTYEEMLIMKGPVFYTRNGLEKRIGKWAPPTQANEAQDNQPEVNPVSDNTKYETDAWLSGYFENNYANDLVRIYSADTTKQTVHCKYPSLQGVQDKRIQLTAINLLCELDMEGEYYIDRFNGNHVLYYYPKSGSIAGKHVTLTSSGTPFFEMNQAVGVTIQGIEMNGSTGYGITMMDCSYCYVNRCEFANISLDAVKIGRNNNTMTTDPSYVTWGGGHDNVVRNCKIHDMGCGGVYLSGGDDKSLTAGNNRVEHCEIYNISRLQTYTPAVYLEGCGNVASFNYIHDAPHMVIQIMGNDMLFTHNKVVNACTNTSDQGYVYSGRCFNWLGNEISYNYFGNIKTGTYAIYMDDGMSGMIIKNNIFDKVSGTAIFSNSGFGHQITDNVFNNVNTTVSYKRFSGSRPVANEKILLYRYYYVMREGDGTGFTNTKENILNWSEHYKYMYPYLDDKFFPEESYEDWVLDNNSVFCPSNQILMRSVLIAKNAVTDSNLLATLRDASFDSDKYYSASLNEIGLDTATGKFKEDSPLVNEEAYGQNWITDWNEKYSLTDTGIVEEDAPAPTIEPSATPAPIVTPTPVPFAEGNGDANQDGVVDVTDVLTVLKHSAQIAVLAEQGQKAADVDGSEVVDSQDAIIILRYIVRKEATLPLR